MKPCEKEKKLKTVSKIKAINAGVVIHMVNMTWQLTVICHVVEMQMINVVVNMQTLFIRRIVS